MAANIKEKNKSMALAKKQTYYFFTEYGFIGSYNNHTCNKGNFRAGGSQSAMM